MDNQQSKTCEKDIAWLAGFLDGEGSICMMRANNHYMRLDGTQGNNRVPRITIANTHEHTLQRVTVILDGLGLPYHVCWRFPDNKKWSPSWHLSIQGMKRFLRWANVFEPYVFTKKEQFEIARAYCESRLSHSRLDKMTENEEKLMTRFTTRNSSQRLNALKV